MYNMTYLNEMKQQFCAGMQMKGSGDPCLLRKGPGVGLCVTSTLENCSICQE